MIFRFVFLLKISLGMVVLAPLRAEFPIVVKEGSQRSPEVVWFGDGYLTAWRGAGIWGARVSHEGVVQDTGGFLIVDAEGIASVSGASGPDRCLLVYCAPCDSGAWSLNGVIVGHDAIPSPPIMYFSQYCPLRHPDVAYLDSVYLVIWEEYHYPQKWIRFARISREGQLLDPYATDLAVLNNWASQPRISAGETCFIAVWSDSARVEATRISISGEVMDPDYIPLGDAFSAYPGSASDGLSFMVSWSDTSAIFARRVDESGIVIDPLPFRINPDSGVYVAPDVSYSSGVFMFAWHTSGDGWDILGARVLSDGTVLDSQALEICTRERNQSDLSIASGPGQFFVAWQDDRGSDLDIYGEIVPLMAISERRINAHTAPLRLRIAPNPFRDRVSFVIDQCPLSGSNLRIFDATGTLIRKLSWSGGPGGWRSSWDGRDDSGTPVPCGDYIVLFDGQEGPIKRAFIKF